METNLKLITFIYQLFTKFVCGYKGSNIWFSNMETSTYEYLTALSIAAIGVFIFLVVLSCTCQFHSTTDGERTADKMATMIHPKLGGYRKSSCPAAFYHKRRSFV